MRKLAFAAIFVALIQAPSTAQIAVWSAPDASPRCEAVVSESRFRTRRVASLGAVRGEPEWLQAANRIVVVTPDQAAILFDAATGAQLAELNRPGPGAPGLVGLSPDGEVMIWTDGQGAYDLRRTSTGELISQPGLQLQPGEIEFSPDGARIAVHMPTGVAILDGKTGVQVGQTVEIHAAGIRFSSDSMRLVAEGSPEDDVVIDARQGRLAYSIVKEENERIEFDGEGMRALVTGPGGWRVVDPASGSQLAKGLENKAAFVGDGAYVLAQNDGDARIFDAQFGRLIARPGKLGTTASDLIHDFGLQVSPDRQTAVTRSPDGVARLWDLARGRGLAELGMFSTGRSAPDDVQIVQDKPGTTGEFQFTPDGERLITRDIVGRLSLWEAHTGRRVATIGQFARPDYLWLAEDSSVALAILADRSATLWNTRSGWRIANLGQFSPDLSLTDFIVSPDMRFLLIGDKDKTELWNIDAGLRVSRREPAVSLKDAVFSANGAWLVLGARPDESAFEIWNARTGGRAGEAKPADNATFYTIEGEDVLLTRSAASFVLWDMERGERAIACQFSDPDFSMMDVFAAEDALLMVLNVGGGQSELWRIEKQ